MLNTDCPKTTKIELVKPRDLTPEDEALWMSFVQGRPDLSGPYFDVRYVKAIGEGVPGAGIARFYDGARVVGYFPYQIRANILQPLGAPLSDYHGLIAREGQGVDFNDLIKVTGVRSLEFQGWIGHICGSVRALPLQRRIADTRLGFEHWYETQKAGHNKFFKNIGRCERNVEKDFGGFDFTWERVTPEVFQWVLALKREQYKKSGLHDIFGCGWTQNLLHNLAAYDDEGFGLRAAVFRHEGRLVAAEISLIAGDSVHLWFPAYDPAYYRYSVGILLTVALMRHLAPLGVKAFDFGTGGEDYKSPLTIEAGEVLEGSLTYAPRIMGRLIDIGAQMAPASRSKIDAVRLSFARRITIIRATETGVIGWARALLSMGQRGLMRLSAQKA